MEQVGRKMTMSFDEACCCFKKRPRWIQRIKAPFFFRMCSIYFLGGKLKCMSFKLVTVLLLHVFRYPFLSPLAPLFDDGWLNGLLTLSDWLSWLPVFSRLPRIHSLMEISCLFCIEQLSDRRISAFHRWRIFLSIRWARVCGMLHTTRITFEKVYTASIRCY